MQHLLPRLAADREAHIPLSQTQHLCHVLHDACVGLPVPAKGSQHAVVRKTCMLHCIMHVSSASMQSDACLAGALTATLSMSPDIVTLHACGRPLTHELYSSGISMQMLLLAGHCSPLLPALHALRVTLHHPAAASGMLGSWPLVAQACLSAGLSLCCLCSCSIMIHQLIRRLSTMFAFAQELRQVSHQDMAGMLRP